MVRQSVENPFPQILCIGHTALATVFFCCRVISTQRVMWPISHQLPSGFFLVPNLGWAFLFWSLFFFQLHHDAKLPTGPAYSNTWMIFECASHCATVTHAHWVMWSMWCGQYDAFTSHNICAPILGWVDLGAQEKRTPALKRVDCMTIVPIDKQVTYWTTTLP